MSRLQATRRVESLCPGAGPHICRGFRRVRRNVVPRCVAGPGRGTWSLAPVPRDGIWTELTRRAMPGTQADGGSKWKGNLVERWRGECSANLLLDLGPPGIQEFASICRDIQ